MAWKAHNLREPKRSGWRPADALGGFCCEVEQGHYGHRARKATWLYCFGTARPDLKWGRSQATATVSFMTNHGGGDLPRLSLKEASSTPAAFREELVAMARTADVEHMGHRERLATPPHSATCCSRSLEVGS